MPALNIPFSDEELTLIRDASTEEDASMKTFAHDAVLEAVRRRKVTAAAIRVARISAGLNKRLAEQ